MRFVSCLGCGGGDGLPGNVRKEAVAEYERDLAEITTSGPWKIEPEQQKINQRVWMRCIDIFPFDDIHKKNDADLIYRFLIAARWNEDKAAASLHEYVAFRKAHSLNTVLWEEFPEEASAMRCNFFGFDVEGNPTYFQKVDVKAAARALKTVPEETLIRAHLAHQEEARRLAKMFMADRVTAILDLGGISVAAMMNPKNTSFWKKISRLDQAMFPELMRTMLILNGGWIFSALWKVLRPILDERVQKKFQFIDGKKAYQEMLNYMDPPQIPTLCGGTNSLSTSLWRFGNYRDCAPGVPPRIVGPVLSQGIVRIVEERDGSQRADSFPSKSLPEDNEFADLEFKSIPSDDGVVASPSDATTDTLPPRACVPQMSASNGGSSEAIAESATKATPFSMHNLLCSSLSASQKDGRKTVELLLVEQFSESGQHKCHAYWEGEHIGTSVGNNVFGVDQLLQGQLLVEAGHFVHTNLIVANEKLQGLFVLRKRNFHREIQVLQPVNPTVVRRKLDACIEGKHVHVFTCREPTGSCNSGDWRMAIHKSNGTQICASQVNDVVFFHEHLLWLPPCYLFALALGVQELWCPLAV